MYKTQGTIMMLRQNDKAMMGETMPEAEEGDYLLMVNYTYDGWGILNDYETEEEAVAAPKAWALSSGTEWMVVHRIARSD